MAIVLNNVESLNNTSVINSNFDKIEDSINDDLLKRQVDGVEANEMRTHLDMNGNRAVNLADGVNPQDAVTVKQTESLKDGVDGEDGEKGDKGDQGIQGETGELPLVINVTGNFTAVAGESYNITTADITIPTLVEGQSFSFHAITDNVRVLNPTNTLRNGTRSIVAGDDLLLTNGQTVRFTAISTTELEAR